MTLYGKELFCTLGSSLRSLDQYVNAVMINKMNYWPYLSVSIVLQGIFCGSLCRKSPSTDDLVSSLFSIQAFKSVCDATNHWFPNKLNVKPLYYLLSPLSNEMVSATRKRIFQSSFSENMIFIERD